MFPDVSKLHHKIILTIDGPLKRFPTKDGERERFDIVFTDGYKAEYCPLVGVTEELPKSGQEFMFKIKHRGPKGDEIEKAYFESQNPLVVPDKRIVNMNGHPAITALNAAVKLAELKVKPTTPGVAGGLDDGENVLTSDVLQDADMILDWLIMKQNNC